MFCARCGTQLAAGANFCSACGAPALAGIVSQPVWLDPMTRLQRPRTNRMVAGVCAGLARQHRWDLTWVRVVTVLLAIVSSGAGVVAYIVFWLVMPEESWMLPAGSPAPGSAVSS